MRILYQIGLAIGLLLVAPVLLSTRRRHYWSTLKGRLGRDVPAGPTHALWIHAVSVGEAMVAASLVDALPSWVPVVVTTITPTGQARAKALIGDRATVTYLPFDLGWTLDPFLDRLQPAALVLVEGDYWPLLLSRLARRGVPTAAINTRIGDRTHARLAGRHVLTRYLMGRVATFGVQSPIDGTRLEALGVPAERIHITGNLKYEAQDPPLNDPLVRLVDRLSAGRPVLLCGSTMPGEEEILLQAYRNLGGGDRALLILAPRHPERWEAVAELISRQGWAGERRSRPNSDEPVDVFLLDSLGELAGLYERATAAFIGGTLSGTGGHNPLEPARYGIPIAVGPSMENFRDMALGFDRARAWKRVEDGASLSAIWDEWLTDPDRARAVGERAAQWVADNQGARQRTLDLLEPILASIPPRTQAS